MENIPGFSNVSRGYLDFHAFSPAKDSDKELFCLPLGTLERRSGEKAGIVREFPCNMLDNREPFLYNIRCTTFLWLFVAV